jgi:hypothetical protein
MAKTTHSGPVLVGTNKIGSGANLGDIVLTQKVYFVPTASITTATDQDGTTTTTYNGSPATAWAATAAAATASMNLPANATILDIVIDQPTVTTGGTAINMTMGISAAGVEYMASTDVKATVRLRPTFTATHLTNMANISTNTAFYVQVTPTATAVTAGILSATIQYVQH